jgi:phosphoribosylglycinamide formyltransferase 1
MTISARIGVFSTMTGAGSRALVSTIGRACRDGRLAGVEVAFVFCNRAVGESADTDASIEAIAAEFDFPVVRASAAAFRAEERRAARAAAEAGQTEALWAWRDAYYDSYRDRLPPTDLDYLLGDMWIWGRAQCAERRGVNLHPALPTGPLGKMWFEVIWDLVAADQAVSGVMLHRVTPDVDRGPVATYCRYSLRGGDIDALWAALPTCVEERIVLIGTQRAMKRGATHPLFHALRARGLAREMPLMLETVRAAAEGRLRLAAGQVTDGRGRPLPGGLDLTDEVERAVAGATA